MIGDRDHSSAVFRFYALGTRWAIETESPLDHVVRQKILQRVARFEAAYARARSDSLVARIAAAGGGSRADFPDDSIPLFDLYDRLHIVTRGAVDPLLDREHGRGRRRQPIEADKTTRTSSGPVHPSWRRDVLRDGASIVTRFPVMIDVGAAGRGHLADILAEMLGAHGLSELAVCGGREVRHLGRTELRVGLQHPNDASLVVGIAKLHGHAICAASVADEVAEPDGHTLARAGLETSASIVIATWVTAPHALVAAGLATALLFIEPERLAAEFSYSFVRMFNDGRLEMSPAFDGVLHA